MIKNRSSNGTFLNGKRLSPENIESSPFELNHGDLLTFGTNIIDENGQGKNLTF